MMHVRSRGTKICLDSDSISLQHSLTGHMNRVLPLGDVKFKK